MTTRLNYLMAAAMLLLAACTADDEGAAPVREETTVDVTVAISGEWNQDEGTRTPPPGAGNVGVTIKDQLGTDDGWNETKDVDCVRLITFRRHSGEEYEYADNEDGFLYDRGNDITISTVNTEERPADNIYLGTHKHRVAQGKIRKSYGYEYRIIALAYNSQRPLCYAATTNFKVNKSAFTGNQGEQNFFTMNAYDGTTLSEFKANFFRTAVTEDIWKQYLNGIGITTHNTKLMTDDHGLLCPPQIFWGECVMTGDNSRNPVIQYSVYDKTINGNVATRPLEATLYRGMAEVVVNIQKIDKHNFGIKRDVTWMALLADHVITEVSLNAYDRFATCPGYQNEGNSKYDCIALDVNDNKTTLTLTAYLLPTKTRLALRTFYGDATTASNSVRNGQICVDNQSTGGSATGVIATDARSDVFYLRRNHKYIINVGTTEYIFTHPLD